MSEPRRPLRIGGFELKWFGGSTASGPGRDRFMELAEQADEAGVQWRDLIEEGYRAPGDLVAGGIPVHFDWKWRIEELQRRLDLEAST
jgi:hypothetical protein